MSSSSIENTTTTTTLNSNNSSSINSTTTAETPTPVATTKDNLPIFLNIPAPLTPDPSLAAPAAPNFDPITEGANTVMPKSGCDAGCVASFILASLVLACLLVALLLGVMKRVRKTSPANTIASTDRKTSKAGLGSRRPESSIIIDDDIRKTLVVRVYPHDSTLFTSASTSGGGGGGGGKSKGLKKQSSSTISSIFSPPLDPSSSSTPFAAAAAAAAAGGGGGKNRDSLKRYVPEREQVNYSGSSRYEMPRAIDGKKHLSETRMDSPISPTSTSRIPSLPPAPPPVASVRSNVPVLAPNPQPILPLDRLNEEGGASASDYDSSSDEEQVRIHQVKQQKPVSWGEQGPYYAHTSQYVGEGEAEFKHFREEGGDDSDDYVSGHSNDSHDEEEEEVFDAVQYERSPHASAIASPPMTSTSAKNPFH